IPRSSTSIPIAPSPTSLGIGCAMNRQTEPASPEFSASPIRSPFNALKATPAGPKAETRCCSATRIPQRCRPQTCRPQLRSPGDANRRKKMSREYKDPPPPREPEHDCESQRHSPRPSKIVERAWYFDRDEARGPCGHDTPDGGECEPPPCQPSGHPTRPPGVSTGRLDDGGPLTRGDINAPN